MVDLDTFACSSMISGLGREGRLDGVVGILDRMTKHGCRPNPRVVMQLLMALSELQNLSMQFGFLGVWSITLWRKCCKKGGSQTRSHIACWWMAFVKASLTCPSTSGSKPLREGFQARCEDAQGYNSWALLFRKSWGCFAAILKKRGNGTVFQILWPTILSWRVSIK